MNLLKVSFLLIIIYCIAPDHKVIAQSDVDPNSVNIENLSNDELKNYLARAKRSGISHQQLIVLARQRGVSETKIQQLVERINAIDNTVSTNMANVITDGAQRIRESNTTVKSQSLDIFGQDAGAGNQNVFGSSLFKNAQLTFEPDLNIPTPSDYVLGPSDEILIDIWGDAEQSYKFKVSPEGTINVKNIGPIYINGLTIDRAKVKLVSKFSKIYRRLYEENGEPPTIFLQLTLGKVRSIKINVLGEVKYPGTYTMSSFATLFNALYFAGGPNGKGSMREVKLVRNNKIHKILDVYNYLLEGKLVNNERLMDNDVIIVPVNQNQVSLDGQVIRSGLFELKPEESFQDLIRFSGGFNEIAYKNKVLVKRIKDNNREIITLYESDFNSFKPKNGDKITVSPIGNRYFNRVEITGAVNRTGEFELTPQLNLLNLIDLADGLREDAFQDRISILRRKEDNTLTYLAINLNSIVQDSTMDIELQKDDIVHIPSIFDIGEKKTVSVQGNVIKPGTYPYVPDMTVEDLILMAGGFNEAANGSLIEIARRKEIVDEGYGAEIVEVENMAINEDLGLTDKSSQYMLNPNDIISVRRDPNFIKKSTITIEGEVKFPGGYVLKKRGERVSDVVNRAGGLSSEAYTAGAVLFRQRRGHLAGTNNTQTEQFQLARKLAALDNDTNSVDVTLPKTLTINIDLDNIVDNPGSEGDLFLQDGDILSIPTISQIVQIHGEVFYPGSIKWDKSLSFKKYIDQSGGFNNRAKKRSSFVVYQNGSASKTSNFLWIKNYPDIAPGSQVIVPRRKEKKRVSIQEFLTISTTLMTLALLVNNLK